MSANEWANIISEYAQMKIQDVPKEYKTTGELAEEFNMSKRTAMEKVKKMYAEGRLEMTKFRISTGSKSQLVAHYKIIKK